MYRFALIGCGEEGLRQAELMAEDLSPAALCDSDPDRMESCSARFAHRETAKYPSFDQLLRHAPDVDAVVLCTPTGYHAEQAIKALQAGKHVVYAAPLCLTTAGAWQILETARYSGRKLTQAPPVLLAKAWSEFHQQLSGTGNIELSVTVTREAGYYHNWRSLQFPGGGMLHTEFYRFLETLVSREGVVQKVVPAATTVVVLNEVEVRGQVSLEFSSGRQVVFSWSANEREASGRDELRTRINKTEMVEYFDEMHLGLPDYWQVAKELETDESLNARVLLDCQTIETIDKIYKAIRPAQS